MSDEAITFLIVGAAVVVFIWDRLPVALVAVGVALALWATGVLTLEESLAGFGDPTVIFIASLFVLTEALESTGLTTWAGRQLISRAGATRTRALALAMALSALLTALITVNGSVAALVPVAMVMAVRLHLRPSKLLMPVAFAAHAGSLLVLTASPVNVLVAEAADDAGVGRIGFFDFAAVGVPLLLGTFAVVLLLGERLLPEREPRAMPPDFSAHARTLVHEYGLDAPDGLLTTAQGVAEVVIPPRSGLVGLRAYPGMITPSGDLVVLAVRRGGEAVTGETSLGVGDVLLLQGAWTALDHHTSDRDVLVVDAPEALRRQAVVPGRGAARAAVALVAMVVLLATGAVPPAVAGLLAAGGLVISGALRIEQAYRGIEWTTVILVAGMIPLSTAMTASGAAERLADGLVDALGDAGPRALLLGVVVLIFVLGQLISNTATALIVIPVALSAAAEIGVSPKPFLVAVAVAAAAAFLTPVATPANLMVMGPAGYRFGDYWRLGLPLMALFGVVAVLLVPVIWTF